ncbi:MAG TPA: Crp/Fnr family transcriptional regulator [Actinomycetota bacterium]|nr:Crp/Fnr family transcriptional regulator [Actinomycetota bacterium]
METRFLELALSPSRRYEHGRRILHQGQEVTSLRFVCSGIVSLSTLLASGRSIVLGFVERGGVFGEHALLGGGPSPVEARALGEAHIALVPVSSLEALARRDPALATELFRSMADRIRRTAAALEEVLAHDVQTRLSRRLCELARIHGVRERGRVRLAVPLTQEELGRMVGASRETVNKTLSALAARGLVRLEDRRYVISDLGALERVSRGGAVASRTPAAQPGCTARTGGRDP